MDVLHWNMNLSCVNQKQERQIKLVQGTEVKAWRAQTPSAEIVQESLPHGGQDPLHSTTEAVREPQGVSIVQDGLRITQGRGGRAQPQGGKGLGRKRWCL